MLLLTSDESQRCQILEGAEKEGQLNFWEVQLIETFLKWTRRPEDLLLLFPLGILSFQMVVESPQPDGRELRFGFGFALAKISGRKARLVYFRIQNHLRKMGLARRALQELLKVYEIEDGLEAVEQERIDAARKELPCDSSKWEAIPTKQMVLKFKRLLDSVKMGSTTSPEKQSRQELTS